MKKMLSIAMVLAASLVSNSWSSVVGHTGKYFTVTDHDRSYKVGRESLDGTLKNINKTNLAMFMKKGRVSAHKTSDGSYVLRGHVNGLGGGPITGWLLYWGTKAVCYGTAAAAAGTAVVATGGLAGAASGAAVAFGTAGASTGAGVVAGAIAGTAGGAALATEVTVASLGAFGSAAGAVAAVESAATGLGLWGLALPLP